MNNCPNCGAPVTKPTCEYCNTTLIHYEDKRIRAEQRRREIEISKPNARYGIDITAINKLYEDAIRAMRRYGE